MKSVYLSLQIFFSTFLATCAVFGQIPPIVYSRAGIGAQVTGQQQPAPGYVINSPQIIGPQVVYSDNRFKAPDVTILGPQAQYTCNCARDCPSQCKYKNPNVLLKSNLFGNWH